MYQSTTMSEPLRQTDLDKTESTKLTSSRVDFPARTLAAPALEKALKIAMGKLLAADCGESTQGSLANLDHDGSWLKMSEGCCQQVLISDREETSELFSGTWPTWGMMRFGRVTVLKPLVRRTKEKESLSWPTPITQDAKHGSISPAQEGKGLLTNKVIEQERNWPTPRANKVGGTTSEGYGLCLDEAVNGGRKGQNWHTSCVADTFTANLKSTQQKPGSMHSVNLSQCVNWPTPTACDHKGAGPTTIFTDSNGNTHDRTNMRLDYSVYATDNKGQLNADWVEILMGLPIGWTDVDCEEPQPWPGWPAPMNAGQNWNTPDCSDRRSMKSKQQGVSNQVKVTESGQYPYEPPRVVVGQKNRAKRLKCLGNGCVPAQVYPIFKAIIEIERVSR